MFALEAVEKVDDSIQLAEDELGGRPTALYPNLVTLTRDTFNPEEHEGIVIFHLHKCERWFFTYLALNLI